MTTTTTNNITTGSINTANGFISFIVGLCAFFIFKLIFMIPINIMLFTVATPENIDILKFLGGISMIASIFLAVKYTKRLNRNGSKKSRNIKRVLTIVAGLVCMFLTTAFLKTPF